MRVLFPISLLLFPVPNRQFAWPKTSHISLDESRGRPLHQQNRRGSMFATKSLYRGSVCQGKEAEETTEFDSGSLKTWSRKLVFELRAG